METAVRHPTVGKKLRLGARRRHVTTADFGLSPEEAVRLAAFVEEPGRTAPWREIDGALIKL